MCHSQSTLLVHDVLSRSLDRNNYVWGGLASTSHSNRNKRKRLQSSPRRLLRVRISLRSVTIPITASPPNTLFPSPPVKPVFSADLKYRSVYVEHTTANVAYVQKIFCGKLTNVIKGLTRLSGATLSQLSLPGRSDPDFPLGIFYFRPSQIN